jgi:hypothetical protein
VKQGFLRKPQVQLFGKIRTTAALRDILKIRPINNWHETLTNAQFLAICCLQKLK